MKSAFGATALVVAFMFVSSATAGATTIAYVATPLGGSTWHTDYSFGGALCRHNRVSPSFSTRPSIPHSRSSVPLLRIGIPSSPIQSRILR